MGQYYKMVNIDKKEFISPVDFGGFAKLMEFAYPFNPDMITSALTVLLADGNNRGGGDLRSDNPVIGSWKYDRIAVVGDYADPLPEFSEEKNLYHLATIENGWKNISIEIFSALMDDGISASEYAEYILNNYDRVVPRSLIILAHAHKDKQYRSNKWPTLAMKAEDVFEKLFPDKDKNYYKTINGIAKHCPFGGLVTEVQMDIYEDQYTVRYAEQNYKLTHDIKEAQQRLRELFGEYKNKTGLDFPKSLW